MLRVTALALVMLVVGASPIMASDDFAGKWVNADKKTRGTTRVEITQKDGKWTLQTWAADGDGERDLGKIKLHLLADSVGDREMKYGIAILDSNFADRIMTLRLAKGELVVEAYTVFKDESERSNYRKTSAFKKAK